MLERLRRREPPAEPPSSGRLEDLERRVASLEEMLEGLQDAVHRDALRRDQQTARLEKKTEPRELARALSQDKRERGL